MKLSTEEHAQLQGLIQEIRKAESAIGQLEYQKSQALQALGVYLEAMGAFRKALQEKYGDIEINVSTGEFEKSDEETK